MRPRQAAGEGGRATARLQVRPAEVDPPPAREHARGGARRAAEHGPVHHVAADRGGAQAGVDRAAAQPAVP